MTPNFDSSVVEAAYVFESSMNRKPTKLLLGKREINQLEYLISLMIMVKNDSPYPTHRTEYRGLQVYAMDDSEFIGVA